MKTKIIATVGPACNSPEKLRQLAEAGVSIFRLNFSHGGASMFEPIVADIRALEKSLGRPLTIMQDLSGPKIRIGDLPDPITVSHGDKLALGPKRPENHIGLFIPFDKMEILESLEPGDELALADGGLRLFVREKRPNHVFLLESANSGIVTSRKGLALPGKSVRLPAMTDKDKKDLRDGLRLGVDAVALSYVQTPDDIMEAKKIIWEHGKNIPVVAKLERQNAVDRLLEILEVVDVVMVARGDLGVECPLPKLPTMQKRIIRACNNADIPVIVATQMLLSMVKNPAPTRAETTDVANAVLDGADCVMLSEETAMGDFPVETVRFMRKITAEAEQLLLEHRSQARALDELDEAADFLSYCACLLAEKSDARALVAHSMTGTAARTLSSRRPRQPLHIITQSEEVLHALNFAWGVHTHLVSDEMPGHLERAEKFIDSYSEFERGDYVITAGQPKPGEETKGTNLVKVYRK